MATTTERIEIIVTDRGTREVQRNLAAIGGSAQQSSSAVQFLRRALIALGGVAVIRGIINLADTFTNLQNRLRIVTNSTAELAEVTDQLFGVANRTRSSFEATSELYARTALAVRELGISQRETIQFTESLNQAIILSGASAQEAQNGLIQLSQGLASNTLRGDELRSVLEQLPVVADVIAKQLGVTRGELRKMGEEGQITADIILEAFRNAREELANKFAKTVPTIGQAFTVLRNALVRAIGDFNKATGASEAFARILIKVAENMDTIVRAIGAVAFVLGTVFATIAVGKAIAAVKALTVAIAANPIGAIAVAITAAVGALVAFSDQIQIAEDSVTTLQDVAVAAFQVISENITAFFNIFSSQIDTVSAFFERVFGTELEFSIKGFVQAAAALFDAFIGIGVGSVSAIVTAFKRLGTDIPNIFRNALRAAVDLVEKGINQIAQLLNELPGVDIQPINLPDIFGDAQGPAQSFGESVADSFVEGFKSSTAAQDLLGDVLDRADVVAQERIARQAQQAQERTAANAALGTAGQNVTPLNNSRQVQELITQLERENELLRLNSAEREIQVEILKVETQIKRELSEEERAQVEGLLRTNQELAVRAQILQEIRGPQEEFAIAQEQLNQLLAEGEITIGQYNQAMTNLQIQTLSTATTAAEGFQRGFLKIKASILDVAGAAENVLTNAFRSAEDALVEFVQTGEFNFSKFVDGILADLTRLLARQAIVALLNSLGGAAGGGTGNILSSLASTAASSGARQAGGPVNTGRSFLVGEKGPELFTPRQSGNIVPNEALGAVPGAPPEVNVQVINIQDPSEVPRAMASQAGDKVILNALARNRDAVKQAIA